MIALVLDRAGLDPTAVIGGRLSAFGSSARLGRGEYMVAEADESDRSFLKLAPTIAVVTNIDEEHLENYRGFEDLQRSFVEFANKVPFYGVIVACVDNDQLRALLPSMRRRVITYGIEHPDADYRGVDIRVSGLGAGCRVMRQTRHEAADPAAGRTPVEIGALDLQVPGRHNLQNALAAVAVGEELGVGFDRIARALAEFRGVERRFQVRGEAGGVLVVDDYGHHPTEIAAVIASARAAFDRRLLVVFQPHRFSRTRQLLGRFGPALAGADELVVTDIYGAGEDPIPGVTTESLVEAIRDAVGIPLHVVGPIESVAKEVAGLARRGDVVVMLGAGSIGAVGASLLDELQKREAAGGL
jgi:UDP-N-acetylmuramate--alanine ligase